VCVKSAHKGQVLSISQYVSVTTDFYEMFGWDLLSKLLDKVTLLILILLWSFSSCDSGLCCQRVGGNYCYISRVSREDRGKKFLWHVENTAHCYEVPKPENRINTNTEWVWQLKVYLNCLYIGLYWTNVTHTLHGVQIRLYGFSPNWFFTKI
jgi:hypothetical protein